MIFHHEKNGEVNKTKRYIFDLIEEKISRIILFQKRRTGKIDKQIVKR